MSDTQTSGVLISVRQAAGQLGMAPSSLYRLCKNGTVPSYAVGSKGSGVRIDIREARTALRRPIQIKSEAESL